MKPNESLAREDADRFRTMRRSGVSISVQSQVPGSRPALADLCELHWCPLYAFVQSKGALGREGGEQTGVSGVRHGIEQR